MAKRKYSETQKIAYASGKAYAQAKQGKRVKLNSAAAKTAFKKGVQAARGR